MNKQINPYDIFELAKSSGRSPSEVYSIVTQEGWDISESAPRQKPTHSKPTSVMNDPKGAIELMRQLKQEVMAEAYRIDPLVRQEMDAMAALSARPKQPEATNLIRDDQGFLVGVKQSVMSGVAATGRNQTELMKAIRSESFKRYGVDQ
jgi:hypothetical protein